MGGHPPGLQLCGRSRVPAAHTAPGCHCPVEGTHPLQWLWHLKRPRQSAGHPAAPGGRDLLVWEEGDTIGPLHPQQHRGDRDTLGALCPITAQSWSQSLTSDTTGQDSLAGRTAGPGMLLRMRSWGQEVEGQCRGVGDRAGGGGQSLQSHMHRTSSYRNELQSTEGG